MIQNLYHSNKISLDQINIYSNQINFCLKSNKLCLWPYINALISLFWRKINLIQTNIYLLQIFCLNQTNFISFKQIISLNQKKSFKQIIFFDSIKSFFSLYSIKLQTIIYEKTAKNCCYEFVLKYFINNKKLLIKTQQII